MVYFSRTLCLFICFTSLYSASLPDSPQPITLRDAIISTLNNQKQVEISILDIDKQEGVLREAGGPFDPLFDQSLQDNFYRFYQSPPSTSFSGDASLYQGSLSKVTRAGTSFNVSGLVENFTSPTAGIGRASQVTFQVTQPILRNFLNSYNTQYEKAAFHELNAVQWDTLQSISNDILNTVNTYWDVAASELNVSILKESIERLEKIIGMVRKLIEGGEIAATDINQPLATIAQQRQFLINAEGALYSNKRQLVFYTGLAPSTQCANLDLSFKAEDVLPPVTLTEDKLMGAKDPLVNLGIERRFDILASLDREKAFNSLVIGAENQTLPQVDFFGTVQTNNTRTNTLSSSSYLISPFYQPAFVNPGSPFYGKNNNTNLSMGVQVSFPLHNDQAEGFLRQQRSNLSQTILRTTLIKQSTATEILQTLNNQIALIGQIREAEIAVQKNQLNLDNESKRLVEGFGNVFFLLDFETRLANAKLTVIDLRRQYYQGIARLRFLTGTLIATNDCNGEILFANPMSYP